MFHGFDTTKWPVVVLTIDGAPNEEEMELFLKDWEKLYTKSMETNIRYKLLFDARKASTIELKHLVRMGKWLMTMKTLTETWMDRTGIMISNPTVKMLIQFVFKFYKAVRPFKIFSEPEETLEWILSDLPGDENESILSMKDFPKLESKIDFS